MSSEVRADAPRSLLVVRLGAMGDVIHTMHAIAALRARVPDVQLGWAIEERWVELLRAKGVPDAGVRSIAPLVDSVHTVNTKKWRKSALSSDTRSELKRALNEMKAQNYEVAADFQGAIKSALVARFSGARTAIGMAKPREAPARILYQQRFPTTGIHVIEQYHSLAEHIAGTRLPRTAPEFPRDTIADAAIAARFGHAKDIVILNPGAGWRAKEWPPERYGEVARAMASDGMTPIINFGPGEEVVAQIAERASTGAAAKISCSISELIALTRRAQFFIGGDTGPLHLAAALQIPVVAIFGPTDPARNGPYGTKSIVLRNAASNTSLSHTNDMDPGLLQITPDEVIAAARQLLKEVNG